MKLPILRRNISNRALAWLCVAALLVSLMPLYVISFFNHAGRDDIGHALLARSAWAQSGGALDALRQTVQSTIETSREGGYSSAFISALQPELLHQDLHWVSTFVLLTVFLLSLWFFLRQVLIRLLQVDRSTFWMAFSAVAFVMIQFVPNLSEAFFWHAGGMAYTFLWSVMLLRLGVWIAFDRADRRWKSCLWFAALVLLTLVLGGAKYATIVFALLADVLLLTLSFRRRHAHRWAELGATALLAVCFAVCALLTGSVQPQAAPQAVSMPMAFLQALYFGLSLVGSWFSLPMLVVWAMVAWQLAEALHGCPYRFNHPIWMTVLSLCLFCAQMIPALGSGSYMGDSTTVNTYFYSFVILSCALVLYWVGWLMQRWDDKRVPFPAIGTAQKDGLRISAFVVALVVLILGVVSYHPEGSQSYGPQNLSGGSALRSLLTGEAQAFDAAMDERNEAFSDPAQTEIVLEPVGVVPQAFMGDGLEDEDIDDVLKLYQTYYNKQRVSVAGEE